MLCGEPSSHANASAVTSSTTAEGGAWLDTCGSVVATTMTCTSCEIATCNEHGCLAVRVSGSRQACLMQNIRQLKSEFQLP